MLEYNSGRLPVTIELKVNFPVSNMNLLTASPPKRSNTIAIAVTEVAGDNLCCVRMARKCKSRLHCF